MFELVNYDFISARFIFTQGLSIMDERAIEILVETHLLADLKAANEALIGGMEAEFEIPGDTPGQKLSYITAAIWIVEKIRLDNCEFSEAYAAYRQVIKQQ